jgi:hypothetical protein
MKKYLLLICLALPIFAFADSSRGERLVKMLWKDIQAKRIKKIAHYTSDQFQLVNQEGIRTRTQFLKSLQNTPLSQYSLLNVQVTEGEKVIIVTYQVLLGGGADVIKQLQKLNPTYIDVWKKHNHEWKLTAEAAIFASAFAEESA